MQEVMLWSATAVSVVTFVVHTFVGGVYVARPLLEDQALPRASKWLNYYCWHVTTILILGMASAFAYCAVHPEHLDLVVFMSALAAALSILSAAVAVKGRIHPLRFPSTSLFALSAVLGGTGLAFS